MTRLRSPAVTLGGAIAWPAQRSGWEGRPATGGSATKKTSKARGLRQRRSRVRPYRWELALSTAQVDRNARGRLRASGRRSPPKSIRSSRDSLVDRQPSRRNRVVTKRSSLPLAQLFNPDNHRLRHEMERGLGAVVKRHPLCVRAQAHARWKLRSRRRPPAAQRRARQWHPAQRRDPQQWTDGRQKR